VNIKGWTGCLGDTYLQEAVITAVVNKRARGMGLIIGRKAFQRPFGEGVNILEASQNVHLEAEITIA